MDAILFFTSFGSTMITESLPNLEVNFEAIEHPPVPPPTTRILHLLTLFERDRKVMLSGHNGTSIKSICFNAYINIPKAFPDIDNYSFTKKKCKMKLYFTYGYYFNY